VDLQDKLDIHYHKFYFQDLVEMIVTMESQTMKLKETKELKTVSFQIN
jgi:hypothetical protein